MLRWNIKNKNIGNTNGNGILDRRCMRNRMIPLLGGPRSNNMTCTNIVRNDTRLLWHNNKTAVGAYAATLPPGCWGAMTTVVGAMAAGGTSSIITILGMSNSSLQICWRRTEWSWWINGKMLFTHLSWALEVCPPSSTLLHPQSCLQKMKTPTNRRDLQLLERNMNNPFDPWQGGRHTELVSELRLDGGRGYNENLQNSLDLQSTGRMQFIIDCVMKLFSKSRMVSNDKSFDRVQKFIKQWFANGKHPGNTTTRTSKIQGNPYQRSQTTCHIHNRPINIKWWKRVNFDMIYLRFYLEERWRDQCLLLLLIDWQCWMKRISQHPFTIHYARPKQLQHSLLNVGLMPDNMGASRGIKIQTCLFGLWFDFVARVISMRFLKALIWWESSWQEVYWLNFLVKCKIAIYCINDRWRQRVSNCYYFEYLIYLREIQIAIDIAWTSVERWITYLLYLECWASSQYHIIDMLDTTPQAPDRQ